MGKMVLITKGFLANSLIIKDSDSGQDIYTYKKNIISRFFILLLRPWFNPVNATLQGENGHNDLIIQYNKKNNNNIFENGVKIGQLLGRKLIATKYRFSISLNNNKYSFQGDSLVPISKMYFNDIEVGYMKIINESFPHFDWEANLNIDIDPRVIAVALLYNYYIWTRV
ncbi:hypothetical protein [Clostridium tarantellae]|uniref:Uncharacterized protein n=1 Tax=Clostridium tarantellae TaxID=39493 RepID=A0A6I1MNX5_9CLOT|nr:hypothetical protein [Clostridium tarantellae]MPQ45125.1 hypothetical protein [Clostridium tarantellae]